MLRNFLLITFVTLVINSIQSQNVPNGGFEQWTMNESEISEPYFWETQNEPGLNFAEKSNGYKGNYSVKLKVVWDEVIKSFTGGSINTVENFAVYQRYDTLSCYYKGNISGNDSLIVNIKLYSRGKLIGFGSQYTVKAYDYWQQLFVFINYTSAEIPDEASISISISPGRESHYQTTYSIDDILLTSINQINYQFKKRRKNETLQFSCNYVCSKLI